jgi:dehydrogenase/reductase SDR family member 7B
MGNTPTGSNLMFAPKHYKKESVVLVQAASSGLGKMIAMIYAKRGASVMLTGRNEAALQEVL